MQELSMNILDIAENSVKAGALLILVLLEYTDDKRLILTIEDNGKGMDEETVKKVSNPFYTSRTTRKVGLGIPFIKMAAEMTGGSFMIESKVGAGTNVKAEFFYEHIDMMPLGNIGETLSALISTNETIDFRYSVKCNGNEFVLDTKEIKDLLGGVSLNNAEVAVFIRDYTNEHTEEVLIGLKH